MITRGIDPKMTWFRYSMRLTLTLPPRNPRRSNRRELLMPARLEWMLTTHYLRKRRHSYVIASVHLMRGVKNAIKIYVNGCSKLESCTLTLASTTRNKLIHRTPIPIPFVLQCTLLLNSNPTVLTMVKWRLALILVRERRGRLAKRPLAFRAGISSAGLPLWTLAAELVRGN